MKIEIKVITGRTFFLELEEATTLAELKCAIYDTLGLVPSQQALFFSAQAVSEASTLHDHGIADGSKLHLIPILKGGGEVYIKTLAGKSMKVEVELESCTLNKLKEEIHKKTGVPVAGQKLVYNAKELAADKTLVEYKISNGATIHLIPILIGGSI
eukprot:TRINITY_DN13486_c0_g1_i2.p1 TRINITY_DN13486_c0_g1~~TRINITY_DN13486_c0_g1_i2.p1  ORF type:complete len:156 (+),score=53.58 TRINITY_DN13486_c0_g1_i2:105-572(+)